MTFKNKEELIDQVIKDEAWSLALEWAKQQKDLESILKNISNHWRFLCLRRGYEQFTKHCDWKWFRGYEWVRLLKKQPQFSEHCDWNKLDGYDWSLLLKKQPQFEKYKKRYFSR